MSIDRSARAARLLVVDDEPTQREMLKEILERAGYCVETAADGREALARLEGEAFDLLLSDQRMPRLDGLELLQRARALTAEMPCVLMTAYGSVPAAVEAMKLGAADYLTKPFNKDELLLVLDKVLRHQRLEREVRTLRDALADRVGLGGLVGNSAPMQEVYSLIERVAGTDVSVLVTGESGTGKELVARAIHERSGRAAMPFVAVNCAAIPEHLLESEFFGHERGAFSGAVRSRPGAFEQADGGTLLLDEIGAMRVDLQAKLLRALQEREVQRLGAERPVQVDVRLIAATSEDLGEAIQKKTFREDLYYRLNVVPIELPPLRDRPEDVPLLLAHFVRRASMRFGREAPVIRPEVADRCVAYDWPGNVRELQNLVERMVVLARGTELALDDLPQGIRDARAGAATGGVECTMAVAGDHDARASGADAGAGRLALPGDGVCLADLERQFIVEALRRSRGSLGPAARMVGLTYKTLQYRIRKYRIAKEDYLERDA